MTNQGIKDYILRLRASFPSARKVSREEVAALIKSLRSAFTDYTDQEVYDALSQWVSTEKFQPTPSEIIEIAEHMRKVKLEFPGRKQFWDDGVLMVYNEQTQMYEVGYRNPVDKSKWTAKQWQLFNEEARKLALKKAQEEAKRTEPFEPTQVEMNQLLEGESNEMY